MKIKKFNQSINESYYVPFASYESLNNKYENLKDEIIEDIISFIEINRDDIMFDMPPAVQAPDGDPGNQTLIIKIDVENGVIADNDYGTSNYGLADFSVEDLLKIIRAINNSTNTYLYQKNIIDKYPREIPDIINNLNKRIKKEYPHLTSGKDLNLL